MEQLLQLTAVAGTLGLLWLTLQGIRRLKGNGSQGNRLRVQQSVAIANGCHLVVVAWGGREMLLATGSHPCTVITSQSVVEPASEKEVSGAWAH